MQIRKFITVIAAALLLAGCSDMTGIETQSPAVTPEPIASETPTPTPALTPVPTTEPEPTPEPYFTEDEQVTVDAQAGYWAYSSPTLWVEVNRVFDADNTITYFAAEVRVKPGSGETERGGFAVPGDPDGKNVDLFNIARNYQAVVAVSGDFLADNLEDDPKGVIIRDGIVCVDDDNEDTVAFMPDGTMRVFEPGEITADELLAEGVTNTFSFGPTLINGGVIEEELDEHRLRRKNPRTAIGMIEPYHYLLIVVDGRDDDYSVGMTLSELAELFDSYGCEVAYNLDGGASATMAFMGEHISQYEGSLTGQRPVADALMFGTSELVTDPE